MGARASSTSKAAAGASAKPSNASGSPSPSPAQFASAVAAATKRRDEAFMRIAFSRHADSKGMLSNKALMAALKEVEAPVLTNGSSAESIFRRADANLSGAVDFDECDPALPSFMPPDVLLMLFLKVHARGSVTRRAGDGSGGQRLASENRSHCCDGSARYLTILCAESYPCHSRMHHRCRQPAGVFRWCFRRGALCCC